MPATPKTRPTKIRMTDRRIVHFTYPYKGEDTPLTFTIRLTHLLLNDEDEFVRMHDHQVGLEVTGIPIRGKNGLCIKNTINGGTRYITSSSVEAGIQLPVPTGDHSAKDILEANGNFIREQLEIHFQSIRRALLAKWTFISFEILEPDSKEWSILPLQYSPSKPK